MNKQFLYTSYPKHMMMKNSSNDECILEYFKNCPPKFKNMKVEVPQVQQELHQARHYSVFDKINSIENDASDWAFESIRSSESAFCSVVPTQKMKTQLGERSVQTKKSKIHEEETKNGHVNVLKSHSFICKVVGNKPSIRFKLKPNASRIQFSNPTASFATRCDVVYKTLLRDCKRYYFEYFQMRKMRKNKRISHLSKVLNTYVNEHFGQYSNEMRRELEFYLGCLVYPKEMTSYKVAVYDQDDRVIRGAERTKKMK